MTNDDKVEPHGGRIEAHSAAWQSKQIGRARAALEIFVALAIFVAASTIALQWALSTPAMREHAAMIAALSIYAGAIAGTVLFAIQGVSWREIAFRPPRNWLMTIASAVAAAIAILVLIYQFGIPFLEDLGLRPIDFSLYERALQGNLQAYILWMLFVVWGSAAIGEELFARGFIMNRFEALFRGAPGAILIAAFAQAVLFGSLHSFQGPIGIILSGTSGFLFGLIFYAAGRRLWVPILAHGFVDSYAITMFYLGKSPIPG
ncbi:MAG: hypothetical protein Tsb0010_10710 [Parvularculaceae bacterium]